jgi:hypothetical protein
LINLPALAKNRIPLRDLNPYGHGFIAATSMNSEGNVTLPAAREIVTLPSSSG